jgi:hypothetical protein
MLKVSHSPNFIVYDINGSEIENKNGFDEHHTGRVHNRFGGLEIGKTGRG